LLTEGFKNRFLLRFGNTDAGIFYRDDKIDFAVINRNFLDTQLGASTLKRRIILFIQ